MEPLAVTIPRAGELLDVSRPTAYRLADRGVLPVVHLGPRLARVPVDELRRRLAEQASAPPTWGAAPATAAEPGVAGA